MRSRDMLRLLVLETGASLQFCFRLNFPTTLKIAQLPKKHLQHLLMDPLQWHSSASKIVTVTAFSRNLSMCRSLKKPGNNFSTCIYTSHVYTCNFIGYEHRENTDFIIIFPMAVWLWNLTPSLPQPVKFPGWKMLTNTPANSIFDGSNNKSTSNTVHFDRSLLVGEP